MQIHCGDCLDILPTLPAQSVQTCVTSPPYFGLRDYQTATWDGGDPTCDHVKAQPERSIASSGLNSPATSGGIGHRHEGYKQRCGKCGAIRIDQQLGLEATPEQYVERMVTVFREVHRVLRDDGTLWLNLGDSYAGGGGYYPDAPSSQRGCLSSRASATKTRDMRTPNGCKAKDLLMMPARVALALQADGWYIRSDIILHKAVAMPESVKDRPTSAHEHVFLLSKQPRYFYDGDAIREPYAANSHARYAFMMRDNVDNGQHKPGVRNRVPKPGRWGMNPLGRNSRNVWQVSRKKLAGDGHFAVMPIALAERCIKAGSRVGDTVLDPFGGVGTTGVAAALHGRDAVVIELNPDYCTMMRERLS